MASAATPPMIAPTTMPVRFTPVCGGGVTGGDTVIAGRDIVVDPGPVEPTGAVELGGIGVAGRDIVDDGDAAAGVAARIPVDDADEDGAAAAERIPVDESEPPAGLGGGVAGLAGGAAEAPGAGAALVADTSVVPHCTQNFALVWVS
jgi:hypothetical protein